MATLPSLIAALRVQVQNIKSEDEAIKWLDAMMATEEAYGIGVDLRMKQFVDIVPVFHLSAPQHRSSKPTMPLAFVFANSAHYKILKESEEKETGVSQGFDAQGLVDWAHTMWMGAVKNEKRSKRDNILEFIIFPIFKTDGETAIDGPPIVDQGNLQEKKKLEKQADNEDASESDLSYEDDWESDDEMADGEEAADKEILGSDLVDELEVESNNSPVGLDAAAKLRQEWEGYMRVYSAATLGDEWAFKNPWGNDYHFYIEAYFLFFKEMLAANPGTVFNGGVYRAALALN